jgi:hypothetical protein
LYKKVKENVLILTKELGHEDVDWIHLTQDRDLWQALVNTVMKLQVS